MKIRCPICKSEVNWEGNKYRPFCSERCKMIDLGSWMMEEYVVEGADSEDEAETNAPPEALND